jgi:hypothetical protein
MELIWQHILQPFLEAIGLFVAAVLGLSLLDRLGFGLENIVTKALNATVVPKLNEIAKRLETLENRRVEND